MEAKDLKIGFNTAQSDVLSREYSVLKAVKDVDFVVCHFDPNQSTLQKACEDAERTVSFFKEEAVDFVANFEYQNWTQDCIAEDGTAWAEQNDGVQRLDLPQKFVDALNSGNNLLGLMYDEFEHAIINHNISISLASKFKIRIPVFPIPKGLTVYQQQELLDSQLGEYADYMKKKGVDRLLGEHVFPVFYHMFAKNGVTPNFKSQKETYSNIQFAIAAGAAVEYKTELWNCIDVWFRNTFPGHSPDEMLHNLKFAYLSGVNRVYVEHTRAFSETDEYGNKVETDYLKNFMAFCEEYHGKERNFDVQDYCPEIGIIRMDDAYWGQWDPVFWRPMLYANPSLRPDKYSKEYLRAIHVVSHGETGKTCFCWGMIHPWSIRKHRSFASMNSLAVFDEFVGKEALQSLKLCFLCGRVVKAETQKALRDLVQANGLKVVTPKRFLPTELQPKIKGRFCVIRDGRGEWIVSEDPACNKVKKYVNDMLGCKGEISLNFRDHKTVLKIAKDGNSFCVKE